MRDIFKAVVASFGKAFKDTFDRADSSSLGTSSSGTPWTLYRGAFTVQSNKAVAGSSSYPIAAVDTMTEDVDIQLKDIANGAGTSLWVTDAGNWWAVGVFQQAEDCNCVEYYNTYNYVYSYEKISGYNGVNCAAYYNDVCGYDTPCIAYNYGCTGGYNCCASYTQNCCGYTCYGYNTSNCCGYTCYGYNAYNSKNKTGGNCQGYYCSCYNGSNCQGNYCSCYSESCTSYECCSYGYQCGAVEFVPYYSGCNNCASYNTSNPNYVTKYANGSYVEGPFYNCQTCYPRYIRVFQSVANTISTIATHALGQVGLGSLRVTTSGNQITAKAYSDTNLVTQVGNSLVFTATGAVLENRFGITVVPSSYSQGYSIGEVAIDSNE